MSALTGGTLVEAHEGGAEGRFAAETRIHQAVNLVQQLPALIFGNITVMAMVDYIMGDVVPTWQRLLFAGAVLGMCAPVALSWWRLRDAPRPARVSERRIRNMIIWSAAMGLIWAVALGARWQPDSVALQIPVLLAAVGLTGGAVASISYLPAAATLYAAPMMVTVIVLTGLQAERGSEIVAATMVVFLVLTTAFMRINYRAFKEAVRVYVDRAQLTERQSAEIARRRAAEEELARSLQRLQETQQQLLLREKMASLGQLTAGIAHEIKNPLNFINNFAEVSRELLTELKEATQPALAAHPPENLAEVEELAGLLTQNLDRIVEHGRRADGIVKGMLLHSRGDAGARGHLAVNTVVEEAVNLAYHGARAQDPSFAVQIERNYAADAGDADLSAQSITRVVLNLVNNAFYAARAKARSADVGFKPTVTVTTMGGADTVVIVVRDNGAGIPEAIRRDLFTPFFTTKPPGEGTGLGLSLSYEVVVQQHGGAITVDSEPGEWAEFRVTLPRAAAAEAPA